MENFRKMFKLLEKCFSYIKENSKKVLSMQPFKDSLFIEGLLW